MDDYSNLGMCLRYIAGAFNWPFIPTNSNFGCDIQFKDGFNAEAEYPCKTKIPMVKDPFTGEDVAVLAPLKPELAVIHVTMADTEGNAGSFGSLWNHFELSRAAKKLVLEADYIVDSDCWRQYPNLAFIPDFLVAAVIPFQLGCWPQASPGIYDCDEEHFYYLNKMCSTQESWKEYKAKYIDGWKTHKEYMKVIGGEEVRKIMDTNTAFLMDPYRKWIKSDEEISELIGEDY
jgi:glutaconate CoA-transferase subunit A